MYTCHVCKQFVGLLLLRVIPTKNDFPTKSKKTIIHVIFTKVIPCFLTVFGKETNLIAKNICQLLKKKDLADTLQHFFRNGQKINLLWLFSWCQHTNNQADLVTYLSIMYWFYLIMCIYIYLKSIQVCILNLSWIFMLFLIPRY